MAHDPAKSPYLGYPKSTGNILILIKQKKDQDKFITARDEPWIYFSSTTFMYLSTFVQVEIDNGRDVASITTFTTLMNLFSIMDCFHL
jgi:hypothetical protein